MQAFRSLEFYVCYYGWGDFRKRSNKCRDSKVYQSFYFIVAIIPYWTRFLQVYHVDAYISGINDSAILGLLDMLNIHL